jgi:hypothetical protein
LLNQEGRPSAKESQDALQQQLKQDNSVEKGEIGGIGAKLKEVTHRDKHNSGDKGDKQGIVAKVKSVFNKG